LISYRRPIVALLVAGIAASSADAAIITTRLDATAVSIPGNTFSSPVFRYDNASSPGITITSIRMSGGAPWDFVYVGAVGSSTENIVPVGGTRSLIEGEERNTDGNNGCTPGITYDYTSFDPGDFARYSVDPETPGCGTAVVDVRPFLRADLITITATFSDGLTLSGSDWVEELIDPMGSRTDADNQRFRLVVQSQRTVDDPPVGVPAPVAGSMLVGAAALVALRRMRAGAARG
jgi:hypothetical protein